MSTETQDISLEVIKNGFLEIQNHITSFLREHTGQVEMEDRWTYHKGSGGGITRVWEGKNKEDFYLQNQAKSTNDNKLFELGKDDVLEKGGVNFSYIEGDNLPSAAATQFNIDPKLGFVATGVSLVIHSYNPNIPTIHMNVRYFQAGDSVWWFGGGVDLTPVYPRLDQVVEYHRKLEKICQTYGCPALNLTYEHGKKECDQYFYLKHRDETRGVGGLFFDHLSQKLGDNNNSQPMDQKEKKQKIWNFIYQLGMAFTELYRPFLVDNLQLPYSEEKREFQLYRRSRYVEFNLLFDRGTKFGIQSEGRIESIFMSLPAVAKWRYNYHPEPNTPESELTDFYLKPQDWLNLSKKE